MDHEAHRADARERWERAADGWRARGDAFQTAAFPVSRAMIEAIEPQPGEIVLELAAGPGDTGFLAAELLRPGGRLITTDGADAMVELAKERAKALGVADMVDARPMELEWIDEKTATVDRILCRFGLMHAVDPETALRESRRVLRPGGRVAFAVWDEPEANPWLAVAGPRGRRDRHGRAGCLRALRAPARCRSCSRTRASRRSTSTTSPSASRSRRSTSCGTP